jgi:NAD(P)H-hydrate repair Nnr-like enzyme with NAD(P)H-hydrate dehydratase domain
LPVTRYSATETLTFLALKPGLLTADAKQYCGAVEVASLGLDAASLVAPHGQLIAQSDVAAYLPRREANTSKGDFGSVGILGGAGGMVGACILAARAALKLGAGRVYAAALGGLAQGYDPAQPGYVAQAEAAQPRTAYRPGDRSGFGTTDAAVMSQAAVSSTSVAGAQLQPTRATHAAANGTHARPGPTILTPHPGEAARLLEVRSADVQADRISAALKLSERFRCHVVLKGAGSICTTPDGNWFINPTGNPGMASAGMGDVLSGMLGALLAQGLSAEQALLLGVYLHGAAGQLVGDWTVANGLSVIDSARSLLNLWIYQADNRSPSISKSL